MAVGWVAIVDIRHDSFCPDGGAARRRSWRRLRGKPGSALAGARSYRVGDVAAQAFVNRRGNGGKR